MLVFAASFVPAAGAPAPQRCASLNDRPSNSTVKVVGHRTAQRGTVLACAPPDGRVRVAGSAYNAVGSELNEPLGYTVTVLAKL